MKKILTILLSLCLSFAAQTAFAENTDDGGLANMGDMASAISQLTAAIEHLSIVMDKSQQSFDTDESLKKLDIAISYLNFRSRRIEAIERDIQQAKTTKDRVEDFLTQMEQRKEAFNDRVRNDPSVLQEEVRQQIEDSDLRIQMMKDRMSSLDAEIIQHENKIIELQSQLDEIERFVSKSLKF